ncbi:MAG: PfaD family polyunsaturated fatty acid/polyketide biosynthesis protein [Phycisphaeraceae bacterium JB051]
MTTRKTIGMWSGQETELVTDAAAIHQMLGQLDSPVYLVMLDDQLAATHAGHATLGDDADGLPLVGFVPATSMQQMGDASFCDDHGLKFAYMTGAMANGIASEAMVIAAAKAGMMGSYGAAGQSLQAVEAAIDTIQGAVGDLPYCFNLIHSPNEPQHEINVVELYIKRGVTCVEASAYLGMALPAVRYRTHGIYRDADGNIVTPNRIIAKASRTEVATHWFSPPPQKMVDELVSQGHLTIEQAALCREIPMAQDLTAEADSGGHTDNRPAISLWPTMIDLKNQMQAKFNYTQKLRVGAGGGISTPTSAAAALAMGADFLVTGSVNQACIESGSCDYVRQALAQAQQADITMAPAADMFEMGVKLQVLKRGTMFPMRAGKLYDLYKTYNSLDEIPAAVRANLEKTVFLQPIDDVWNQTREFFLKREPAQAQKADRDPKHKMALVFRWYLGLSSRWANAGDLSRKMDFQIWCGPAMGAFNQWTTDTFLADYLKRDTVTVGLNLIYGAAVASRLTMLANQGVSLEESIKTIKPQTSDALEAYCK